MSDALEQPITLAQLTEWTRNMAAETTRKMEEFDRQMAEQRAEYARQRAEREREQKEREAEREREQREYELRQKIIDKKISSLGDRIGELIELIVESGIVRKFRGIGYEFTQYARHVQFKNKALSNFV